MWAALFGSGGFEGQLILRPSPSGKQRVSGFFAGQDLTLRVGAAGETIQILLDRLNTYRGPTQQIRRLWTLEGEELKLDSPVKGQIIAEVRAESI
jgi:hypothetical protein